MSKNQKHIEAARRLEEYLLSEGIRLPHRKALEAVARVENERNWNMLAVRAETATVTASPVSAPEVQMSALPAFDFLPQHYQVTRLLELCTKLLAKTGIPADTQEYEQAVQQLREFENLSVWGDWTARDLEQAFDAYRCDHGIEDDLDAHDEPIRTALKYALHGYQDAHSSTESDISFLETLVRNELDSVYER